MKRLEGALQSSMNRASTVDLSQKDPTTLLDRECLIRGYSRQLHARIQINDEQTQRCRNLGCLTYVQVTVVGECQDQARWAHHATLDPDPDF